jgi:hypothetical protein
MALCLCQHRPVTRPSHTRLSHTHVTQRPSYTSHMCPSHMHPSYTRHTCACHTHTSHTCPSHTHITHVPVTHTHHTRARHTQACHTHSADGHGTHTRGFTVHGTNAPSGPRCPFLAAVSPLEATVCCSAIVCPMLRDLSPALGGSPSHGRERVFLCFSGLPLVTARTLGPGESGHICRPEELAFPLDPVPRYPGPWGAPRVLPAAHRASERPTDLMGTFSRLHVLLPGPPL